MISGIEEPGVRQAGGGRLEDDEGQAGCGGLGVDEPVVETELGTRLGISQPPRKVEVTLRNSTAVVGIGLLDGDSPAAPPPAPYRDL